MSYEGLECARVISDWRGKELLGMRDIRDKKEMNKEL